MQKDLKIWRDANPGYSVLEGDAMTNYATPPEQN
jgi:hypothetical protein